MNNYYFEYDSTGSIVSRYLQATAPTTTSGNSILGPFDQNTASPDVVTAYQYPNRYLVQGSPASLVAQPYLVLSLTSGTGTMGTGSNQYNVVTNTVTASIQGTPATTPTDVSFSLFGSTFTAPVTNGQAQLTIATHPSVNNPQVDVTASSTGIMSAKTTFGQTVPSFALKAEIPSGETNPVIHPCGSGSRSVLSAYWTSTATNSSYTSADIATIIGLHAATLYAEVIPQMLTAGTLTLSDNAKNFCNFMKNTLLPTMPSSLETAAPLPAAGATQTFDVHFNHYQSTQIATQTAISKYEYDVQRFTDVL